MLWPQSPCKTILLTWIWSSVDVAHAVLTGASAAPSSGAKLKGSFTALKPSARRRVTCVLKSAVALLSPCK